MILSFFRAKSLPLVCVLSLLFFTSCASAVLKSVENTNNPSLKMVIARSMISQTRYNLARKIFDEIKKTFPNDAALLIEIDYEDAYIDFSKKKYLKAKEKFTALIQTYDTNVNNTLPKWPFYLSKKIVEKNIDPILEKRAQKKIKKRSSRKKSKEE